MVPVPAVGAPIDEQSPLQPPSVELFVVVIDQGVGKGIEQLLIGDGGVHGGGPLCQELGGGRVGGIVWRSHPTATALDRMRRGTWVQLAQPGAIGSHAAVANAVSDAVAHLGVRLSRTPLGPNDIFALVQEARTRS